MNDSSPPRQAAIYCRVSTEDQGKGFSIPTQIEACQKLAEHEGYCVPETHIIIEEYSGATMERPGLQRLRELVRGRAIAAVIVYDLDRLSRRLGHQSLLLDEMERERIVFHVVASPIENTPEGMLLTHVRGAMAEYEHAKIRERTKRGMLGRAKAGHVWGGVVPLGYRYVSKPHGGTYVIDEEEATLVRRIYQLCLDGLTMRAIALRLTDERIPTAMDRGGRGGGPRKRLGRGVWHRSSVHAIVSNPVYAGMAAFDKRKTLSTAIVPTPDGVKLRPRREWRQPEQWIRIAVPPIVDESTWQAAQAQLARNKDLSFRNMKPGRMYLLRPRWFRCGRCRLGMAAFWQHGRVYYRCASHHERMDRAARCRGTIRGEEAEGRVWTVIMRLLKNPELVAQEVAKHRETAQAAEAAIDQELAAIAMGVERCDQDDRRLVDAYVAGAFTPQELKAYRAEVTTRRQGLDARRQELLDKQAGLRQAADRGEALITYCARVREQLQTFTSAEKQLVFDALALKIAWTPGEPLRLDATIPLDGDGIASNPSWCIHLRRR